MSLKAILIDDEINALKMLESKLTKLVSHVNIVGKATSVKEGIAVIKEHDFDILFLDIELRDGSGFNLLEHFDEIKFEVIFVTAYNQYAIKALKANAVDYLLKPIESDELVAAVKRAEKRINSASNEVYNRLSNLLNEQQNHKKLALKERGKISFVDTADIIYLKADGVYTEIVTTNYKYLNSNNLGYFENILNKDIFSRIHRSYLVNVTKIDEYFTADHQVKMSDGSLLPVANSALKG